MITEKEIYETIGKNIKKYRLLYSANNESLTQSELASRVGISTSLIGGLESRKVSVGISLYNLYKISEVLNVSINKFFE